MIEHLSATTELAIGIGALLALVGGWLRWVRPKYRAGRRDFTAARDAILGREAQVDSITGEQISPALPGIGQRVHTIEQAVMTFAENRRDIDFLMESYERHEGRIVELERASVERIVTRAESTAAFRAMEEAVKATPDEVVGDE